MRCTYCEAIAMDEDALGFPVCLNHIHEMDEYFESRTGRKSNDDPHLYCGEHGDMWEPGCVRCEECSQHHYGMPVAEFLKSPLSRWGVFTLERE